jgi:hypothetical protein
VAPTSNAATPSNGFEFFHNSIADTVKFCVDEWDESGQHRIYHKCVRVSPGRKWGHYNSPGARHIYVHLQDTGWIFSQHIGSENYGPLENGRSWCFKSRDTIYHNDGGFLDNMGISARQLDNCTFG